MRLELQADCFAGVWGKHADSMKKILQPGELEQALTAAAAIGDDRLQQSRGRIVPESFARQLGATRALVPRRLRFRRREPVQHLRRTPALADGVRWNGP